jgi:hypothetical protein
MPSSCFAKSDRVDFGYHDKRVLYLAEIAKQIKKKGARKRSAMVFFGF